MTDRMSLRERALAAIKHQPVDRIPFFDISVDKTVAEAIAGGRDKLLTNPKTAELLNCSSPLKKSLGSALLECDISRLLWRHNINWWGCMGLFASSDGPHSYLLNPEQKHLGASADGAIKTIKDIDAIEFVKKDDAFWENAKVFVDNKSDFAAGAMLWLGIDPVWHSMGYETFATTLLVDHKVVEHFMDRVTDWLAEAAIRLNDIGFDFIWAADDIAFKTQPFFSPALYREHLLPYTMKVAKEIKLPWIYHSDGNLLPLLDDLLSQGMDAIHPLEPGAMDIDELKRRWGDKITLVGNIDLNTLSLGTPEQTRQEVKDRICRLGPGYGYILSSGNSISDYCKPENVLAMVNTIKELGHYPLHIKKKEHARTQMQGVQAG
ncbi:MAG: uroporphyrinogen decarboxylase family protein [Planctomycetota bacterium]|nr:uroporphyrinogen decarboxylase family protein [Planctomycetota bacterium]